MLVGRARRSSDSQHIAVRHGNATRLTEYRYKAWGETRYSSGRFPTNDAFTGQYFDNDMGLYYYGARWYDSALGRWAQSDSIVPYRRNPQSWDRYSYVRNDPMRFNDPSGHLECDPEKVGITGNWNIQNQEAYQRAVLTVFYLVSKR